jgi:hypothetical protein
MSTSSPTSHTNDGLWHEADIASTATIGFKPDLRNFDQTAGFVPHTGPRHSRFLFGAAL